MRILCLQDIPNYTFGILQGLRKAGCTVRLLQGRPVPVDLLRSAVEDFRPDLLFTYGRWDLHLSPGSLAGICRAGRLPHVYWAGCDPVHHEWLSRPMARIADLIFTTAEELIPIYRAMGRKAAHLQFGCDPDFHRPHAGAGGNLDAVLVAHNYSNYDPAAASYRSRCLEIILRPLVEAGLRLKAYGIGWADPSFPFRLPEAMAGPVLPYRRIPRVYSRARIVLGLQTECHSPTSTSSRFFEVLGCRAFHLAPLTRASARLFQDGRHLVLSDSPLETLALARYYLEHEEERRRIAAAGQEEVYRKHTYLHRAREFLSAVRAML